MQAAQRWYYMRTSDSLSVSHCIIFSNITSCNNSTIRQKIVDLLAMLWTHGLADLRQFSTHLES